MKAMSQRQFSVNHELRENFWEKKRKKEELLSFEKNCHRHVWDTEKVEVEDKADQVDFKKNKNMKEEDKKKSKSWKSSLKGLKYLQI